MTDGLALHLPSAADEGAAARYHDEHLAYGEETTHGAGGLFEHSFAQWLSLTEGNMRPETVRPGLVPATTFF